MGYIEKMELLSRYSQTFEVVCLLLLAPDFVLVFVNFLLEGNWRVLGKGIEGFWEFWGLSPFLFLWDHLSLAFCLLFFSYQTKAWWCEKKRGETKESEETTKRAGKRQVKGRGRGSCLFRGGDKTNTKGQKKKKKKKKREKKRPKAPKLTFYR